MFKKQIQQLLKKHGYQIVNTKSEYYKQPFNDMCPNFKNIYHKCMQYTMTPWKFKREKMYALYEAVNYIIRSGISGDFVECGVWKGGNPMLIAYTLLHWGIKDKKIYLYDTFAGMTKPTDKDTSIDSDVDVLEIWKSGQKDTHNEWDYVPFEEVRANMLSTGYPEKNIIFVKGDVLETIPKTTPKHIALLRLDTDWYESTYHELVHLYPLLAEKGALIIDDYGAWAGSREAVNQYFQENNINMLLNRIDNSARLGIKTF